MNNIPKNVLYSVAYIVGLCLYIRFVPVFPGHPGLASVPGFLLLGGLIYSVWTILWYISRRWPLVGIFIVGTLWSAFGGRRRGW